jgi:hypothetical protein
MERISRLRTLALAGLAASATAVGHGGPAVLSDPRWMLPALAGAVACCLLAVRLAGIAAAHLSPVSGSTTATAAILVAGQLAAHQALIESGVHASPSPSGSLALHVALGLAGALVIRLVESLYDRSLASALRTFLELLAGALLPQPLPARAPAVPAAVPPAVGRAPPSRP